MARHTHERWEHLVVLLGEMRTVFQGFMTLLADEERVLLRMDRQGVVVVVEKKEQALDLMCRYERQVMAMFQELMGVAVKEPLGAWLHKTQEPQAQLATTIYQDIREVIRVIQVQGEKNTALITRMQQVVHGAITIIYTGLGSGPVYQGSGTLQVPAVPSSVHFHG